MCHVVLLIMRINVGSRKILQPTVLGLFGVDVGSPRPLFKTS